MKLMDATIAAGVKVGNVSEYCRVNKVSRATYYRHKERIEAEGEWRERSRRPKTSPGQTPAEVEEEIVRLRRELGETRHGDNGADVILAELRQVAERDRWADRGWRVPARSTVNAVLARRGLVSPAPGKRPKSSFRRFCYARPRDCYQIDAVQVRLAGGGTAVLFEVLDDCTRLLAASVAAGAETAAGAAAAINAAAAAHGAPAIVLSDNGAAFTGGHFARSGTAAPFGRAVTRLGSRLIHSSPYHPQTQGKVERHHQTFRKWLESRPAPADLAGLQALADEYRAWYNTARWHSAVGAAPQQAWDAAPSLGGPGHLPRQDDASVHELTVAATGAIKIGHAFISVGKHRARHKVTAIRDHDRVTVYTRDGDLIGYLTLDHGRHYQGQLKEAA
jgi:putative transposase